MTTEVRCYQCGGFTELTRTTTHCSECGEPLALEPPTPLWKLRDNVQA